MRSNVEERIGNRRERWALGVLMFLLGGCGLAYEYTLSKIASDLLGNSIRIHQPTFEGLGRRNDEQSMTSHRGIKWRHDHRGAT